MTCAPATLYHDSASDFVFPVYGGHGSSYTPVDIPIRGCGLGGGLAMLPQGPALVTIPIRTFGHPDADLNWVDSGWWLRQDIQVRYASRDENWLYGVTKYPSKGKLDAGQPFNTGYYNPNAYWTPPPDNPGEPPPPGADPTAEVGQDPETVDPPDENHYVNRPYKYATLRVYDFMGVNRTGYDLSEGRLHGSLEDRPAANDGNEGWYYTATDEDKTYRSTGDEWVEVTDEDPDHGVYLDPALEGVFPLTLVYDDQDPDGSNLANGDWEPDGEQVKNQQVALVSSYKEHVRGIRKIARNIQSWREIGVYSSWDGIGGSNAEDASEDNIAGHAMMEVQRYGRVPNFLKLYLPIEAREDTPERGTDEEPAFLWKPRPLRDFGLGDRVLARVRKGYMDTGLQVVRIMGMTIRQLDANNNVQWEIECVPHVTELGEISVV